MIPGGFMRGTGQGPFHCFFLPLLFALLFVSSTPYAEAQQIYRWTDENGTVHFGNQPPPDAADVEARGRKKSGIEVECETAAKKACGEYLDRYGRWYNSEAYRDCVSYNVNRCQKYKPKAKPTKARQRVISTAAVKYDPKLGDSLRCEMSCPKNCRGKVEILSNRVLKKGENLGSANYVVEVEPSDSGSAYCKVSTRNKDVSLRMSVVRKGDVVDSTEAQ